MIRFDNILFPIDLSASCVQMAPYVAAIAKKFTGNLTLLHVVNASDACGFATLGTADEISRFGESTFSGLRVNRVLKFGKPGPEIIRYAFEQNIDLLFMPTHGYGGFQGLLLGSVTSAALHEAHCPVWTATHTERFCGKCSQHISQIVCGVDLGPNATALVRTACEFAHRYGANLLLVHAVGSDLLDAGAPFQRFLLDTAEQKLGELQVEAQTHLATYIRAGSTATVMREATLETGAQLMIVGRGHASGFLGGLRTDIHAVIRESPCPVLSF